MVKAPQKYKEPKKPLIFLFLAALMVVGAILGYVYEDELFFARPYRDVVAHNINVYFILILLLSVLAAFFFLMCYLNPRFGNRLIGRNQPIITKPKESVSTVTYNVFDDTTAASVKSKHRKRKTSRHTRHKLAEATREMEAKKKKK